MSAHLRPIFVIGAPHSGTSILYNMLAWHPDLGWFSQYSQRGGKIPGRRRLPYYKALNRTGRRLFQHKWQKYGETRAGLIPRPTENSQIWNYVFPLNNDFSEVGLRMRSILEDEAKAWEKNRLIFKEPSSSTRVSTFREIFPTSKFVHIVRDGRAVSLSLIKKGWFQNKDRLQTLENSGRYWADIISSINAQKEGAYLLDIKYEDFCKDPVKHILDILGFLELEKTVFPADRCPDSITVTNSKYYTNLGSNELDVLESTMQKWLDYYKYEPLDSLR